MYRIINRISFTCSKLKQPKLSHRNIVQMQKTIAKLWPSQLGSEIPEAQNRKETNSGLAKFQIARLLFEPMVMFNVKCFVI